MHPSHLCTCLYLGSCINNQVFACCGVLLTFWSETLPDERPQSTAGKSSEVRDGQVTPSKHLKTDPRDRPGVSAFPLRFSAETHTGWRSITHAGSH